MLVIRSLHEELLTVSGEGLGDDGLGDKGLVMMVLVMTITMRLTKGQMQDKGKRSNGKEQE